MMMMVNILLMNVRIYVEVSKWFYLRTAAQTAELARVHKAGLTDNVTNVQSRSKTISQARKLAMESSGLKLLLGKYLYRPTLKYFLFPSI